MQLIKRKLPVNTSILIVLGILILLFGSVALLWSGRAHSNQAMSAMLAKVYFDGEYRIADGSWQKIVKGNHIPATDGDVTLRGNLYTPVASWQTHRRVVHRVSSLNPSR